jgi:DNA helicase-2/ATP-dependent DNA helicase PcrA
VLATRELLERLLVPIKSAAGERRQVIAERKEPFADLADQLGRWGKLMRERRPPVLLGRILEESGLATWWGRQPNAHKRLRNLEELCEMFERYDSAEWAPEEALQEILNVAALGNDADRYLNGEDRVLLLTVHQAKGLEFDTVFLAAATDNEFPAWLAQKEGRIDEEHRLFYVAATRARRRLLFSWHEQNQYGKAQVPSRFLRFVLNR